MSIAMQRTQFLRGDFTAKRVPLRPPWAILEIDFVDTCTRCGECLSACPEKILRSGQGGFPQLDFSRGECTFCAQCVDACQVNALVKSDSDFAWQLKAEVTSDCLAYQGVVCVVCGEHCEVEAIRFTPQAGRVAAPEINLELCNGCGACYRPCPGNAISIQNDPSQQPQHTILEVR